jgi:hypothetical protein
VRGWLLGSRGVLWGVRIRKRKGRIVAFVRGVSSGDINRIEKRNVNVCLPIL